MSHYVRKPLSCLCHGFPVQGSSMEQRYDENLCFNEAYRNPFVQEK